MKKSAGVEGGSPTLPKAADILAKAALFSSFSRDELELLAERSEFIVCEDGQKLFEPGDAGDRLYLVASGDIVIRSPDGAVLAEFVAGDSFGELELLTRSARNASAVADGEATVLTFPAGGESIQDALSSRPEVAARIMRSFLLVISGRTRKSNALVKENSPWVRELRKQVYGDKLTGLLNKAYLEENLPRILAAPLALIMMKPDNFKEINDRFGHEVGDAALVLMAGELERAVGKEGTAVRYMGNELAVTYPGMDRERAVDAARAIQARLTALDLSKLSGDPDLRLSMSFGIALYDEHGKDADTLIKASAGLPLVARSRGGSLILFPEDAE
jgi:diguanylate cyclase (GGDEF)-like protein